MSRNQFFYLYGLATQTVCADEDHCRNATKQEKDNYFSNGNAEWAKQQLIYYLDANEISKRMNEQTIAAMGPTGRVNTAISLIKNIPALVKYAEQMGKNSAIQQEADSLVNKFLSGNANPGIGTKNLFGDVFYLRGRDGARVFYRIKEGTMEILAKADKAVEQKVIDTITKLYGNLFRRSASLKIVEIKYPTDLSKIKDITNDNVDIIVRLDDGNDYTLVVTTPKNYYWYMDKEGLDFIPASPPDIIVRELTYEIIRQAVETFVEGNGFWIKFYFLAGRKEQVFSMEILNETLKEINEL